MYCRGSVAPNFSMELWEKASQKKNAKASSQTVNVPGARNSVEHRTASPKNRHGYQHLYCGRLAHLGCASLRGIIHIGDHQRFVTIWSLRWRVLFTLGVMLIKDIKDCCQSRTSIVPSTFQTGKKGEKDGISLANLMRVERTWEG